MKVPFSYVGIPVLVAGTLMLTACGGSSSSSGSSTTTGSGTGTTASVNEWAWIGGSQTANAPGVYGTIATAAAGNVPGARSYAATWADAKGNRWLFGGFGYDSNGGQGVLNDLWKYDASTSQWTWVSGSKTVGATGSYGTQGAASATNVPGARENPASWRGPQGNLWLFGGDSDTSGLFDDLWKYDPATGQWTWVGGSNSKNVSGTYGTKGTGAPGNMPGARRFAVAWQGPKGNLWLFGGSGYDSTGTKGDLNDLWKYDPATGKWTWVSGSNAVGGLPVYGQQGVAASGNVPGALQGAVGWVGPNGSLWLFGGENGSNYYNTLWKYDPTTNEWTWVSGANTPNAAASYGAQGTASASNVPGPRYASAAWVDKNGMLWLFGGLGYDSSAGFGDLNDLWKYDPTTNQWTWVSGSKTKNASGNYGTRGTASAGNTPGGRDAAAAWLDPDGTTLWLFGGEDYSLNNYNDLWKYQQ